MLSKKSKWDVKTGVTKIINKRGNGDRLHIRSDNRSIVIKVKREEKTVLRPMGGGQVLLGEERTDGLLQGEKKVHICCQQTLSRQQGRCRCTKRVMRSCGRTVEMMIESVPRSTWIEERLKGRCRRVI